MLMETGAGSARNARRKQLDQRRMAYRRAIEERAENRRLQALLSDFPS